MPWRPVAAPKIGAGELADLARKVGRPGRRPKQRFLVDHNVPSAVVDYLRKAGSVVRTATEAGIQGHADEDYISKAHEADEVIVTCDRDFLDGRKFPVRQCPAIVVLDLGDYSNGAIASVMSLMEPFVKYPRLYDWWAKITLHPNLEWTEDLRFEDGTSATGRFRLVNGRLEEWAGE